MSIAKNPLLRYSIIDQCLSNHTKTYWPPKELFKVFEDWGIHITLRTLKRDILYMRENPALGYNVNIEYCRTNNGYYYKDRDYIPQGHSPQELMALAFVVDLLTTLENGELTTKARNTVKKLSKRLHTLQPTINLKANVICIEPHTYNKSVPHLPAMLEAIYSSKVLAIDYQKFNAPKPDLHIFHPYQLKTYLSRWYVRGYSEKHKDTIILGLDRIENMHTLQRKPYRQDTTSATEFFHYTLGVTRGTGPVEEIRLHFTPEQGHYIKTLHLHHSQQTIHDDADGVVITLQLIPNHELCQLIMSYMPNVKVLKPLSLRKKITGMLQDALKLQGVKVK